MSDTMQSLDQLSQLKPAAPDAPKYVKKVDKYGRAYATGKRKDAVARVWIKPGAGKVIVNTREVEVYFARPVLRMMIQQPLVAAARAGQYDVIAAIDMGRIGREVFAAKPHRDQGSEPADHQTLGVDQHPLLGHLGWLCRKGFHVRKSVKGDIGAERAELRGF